MPLRGMSNVKKMTADSLVKMNDDVRGVYLAGLFNIVEGTPVDSGRARNNWFLSVSAPSQKTTKSKSKGLAAIRQLRTMPQSVLNKKLYFTNNLPYIGLLEYGGYPKSVKKGTFNKKLKKYEIRSISGYSKQMPRGWVRVALRLMANKIRKL